ncbi:MAG: hypothetical protein HKN13_10715, partial [Rhodothermales bacterium]|nr:hypothetical protein [Rhodothermales bacterium]
RDKAAESGNRPGKTGTASTSAESADEETGLDRIQVGDQVVIDSGSTAVEVLALDGKNAELAFSSGRMRVAVSRLQKVGGKRKQSVNVSRVRETGRRGELIGGALQRRVDLRGSRVDEAIGIVTKLVDEAVAAGMDSVEILHGKGTGALRAAIRDNLIARTDVRSAVDAPIESGGSGITIVELDS